MSDYCSDCGRFHAEGAHSPLWQCRVDDWRDDETQDIRATDAEDAAERFLEYCWSNRDGWEWILSRNSNEASHTIIVTGGGKRYRVNVDVELAPRYTANAEEWVFAHEPEPKD